MIKMITAIMMLITIDDTSSILPFGNELVFTLFTNASAVESNV